MCEPLTEMMTVEVAYALPQKQWLVALSVPGGTTALEAIQRSGLLLEVAEISIEHCQIGVFGKLVSRDTVLQALDRVEIYRPLIADPKQARRLRAALKDRPTKKRQAAKTGQKRAKKG